MTGFASRTGEAGGRTFQIDVRSVNGRSLDVRLRLPPGYERQEVEWRRKIGSAFKRGSISVSLSLQASESETRYSVNEEQLSVYLDAIRALGASDTVAPARADGLLNLRGVIEGAQEEGEVPDLGGEVSAALKALAADREEEGERIAPVIAQQLAKMEELAHALDNHPERALPAIKARIERQVADLLSGASGLSADRLHQEAALIATRADIREELDRLSAHIAAARGLLSQGGAIGRKLDFLAQELNRETNTVCAKAPHHEMTALGLELKATIEQMREQVQNIE